MLDLAGRYCAHALSPYGLIWSWNIDPVLLTLLGVATILVGRLPGAQRRAGLAAVGVLAIAFVSPLCALSASLFSARSVHHLLIVGAAAPLLARALPPMPPIRPTLALIVSTALLWGWHVPALYDRALNDIGWYWTMQVSLLGGATLFWAALRTASLPAATAAVLGGAVQMGLLGAILTLAPRPLYAAHLSTTVAYGLGPLGDQQLGGLVMWTVGMIPYVLAGWLIARASWGRLGGGVAA